MYIIFIANLRIYSVLDPALFESRNRSPSVMMSNWKRRSFLVTRRYTHTLLIVYSTWYILVIQLMMTNNVAVIINKNVVVVSILRNRDIAAEFSGAITSAAILFTNHDVMTQVREAQYINGVYICTQTTSWPSKRSNQHLSVTPWPLVVSPLHKHRIEAELNKCP